MRLFTIDIIRLQICTKPFNKLAKQNNRPNLGVYAIRILKNYISQYV